MKINYFSIVFIILIVGCQEKEEIGSINHENWSKRAATIKVQDSLEFGKSYLSIYSQIYSLSEYKTHNLTAMVSMRNTSDVDTIYILKAEYYNTSGKSIRKYFEDPIFLAPMETTEIVINQIDTSGGTGSNFIFEWKMPKNCSEPLFEGVMTSMVAQQGLSFTTQAKRIN